MIAVKYISYLLYSHLVTRFILRFGKAMHLNNAFIAQEESEKEPINLKKMFSSDEHITADFLSLSSPSMVDRFEASSKNNYYPISDNEHLNHPEDFLSKLGDQQPRKKKSEDVNSGIISRSSPPPVQVTKKSSYEKKFYSEGSKSLLYQPLNPISFLKTPSQNSISQLEIPDGSYSTYSMKIPVDIPIYYLQNTNQIPNLPIGAQHYNNLYKHSESSAKPIITNLGENSYRTQIITPVKQQMSEKNWDLEELHKKSKQKNLLHQAENNDQRMIILNSLHLNETPKFVLKRPVEIVRNQAEETLSSGRGQLGESLINIKKRKRPAKNFNHHEVQEKNEINFEIDQLEKTFLALITRENQLLWPEMFQNYRILFEGILDNDNLLVLNVLQTLEYQIDIHQDKSLYIKNNEIIGFLKTPQTLKFKLASDYIVLTHNVENSNSKGFSFIINLKMGTVSFKDIVKHHFIPDGSEIAEWWGKVESKYDILRKKKFVAKMFLVYSMIINKVFSEKSEQDLFMKKEKQAVNFLIMVLNDANVDNKGKFFLEMKNMPHLSDLNSTKKKELENILNGFNFKVESTEYLSVDSQLGLTWRLIELWLIQYRYSFYRTLKTNFKLTENFKPFVNLLLKLHMKTF
ncbi:hypothetical protein BY996DRAFT_2755568 [Phakopsora pachyrhizi]|uniref:Expressed protein n=1 Tax=Phakopsora pachyrhizi TaxID=170000 RepID=A0AAV0BJL6_PHAPC|nr:hypothetical protein BY996DRAFT_2755568 [Phakopsora pachyrhizi]CAH7686757.1 expressed protein [Phakopsora pachyrhizi]